MFTIRIDVLKAMLVICPKKDARSYLNGIYVERVENTLCVVCTDGHRMLTYTTDDPGDDFNVMIPPRHARLFPVG